MTRPRITDPHKTLSGGAKRIGKLLGVSQLGVGATLALRPRQLAVRAAGPRGHPAPAWLVRGLGIRSLVQGAVTIARPTSTVLAVGALVDATHAASMAPIIVVAPRHRRAATLSGAIAVLSAAVGSWAADRRHATRNFAS